MGFVNIAGRQVVQYDPNDKGIQESDLLDRVAAGEVPIPPGTEHLRFVSLGCYCGPKLTFQKMGRGAETLPFDWIRCRMEAILHFIRNDFEGYFDYTTEMAVPNCRMVMYRGRYHSFWHDDPREEGMRTRYERRFARFKSIDAGSSPVLFVRVIVTTDELQQAEELLNELISRFGKQAYLLLVLEFQTKCNGPAFVQGCPNLMIYFLEGDVHSNPDGAPYRKPVQCAIDWLVGKELSEPAAKLYSSIGELQPSVDETHWGLVGLGGLLAFEEPDERAKAMQAAATISSPQALQQPVPEPPLESDLLERSAEAAAVTPSPSDGIALVSLGCYCGPKLTFQQMGCGAAAQPFDWIRVSLEGVMQLIEQDFQGFFDYTSVHEVPGMSLTMYRHRYHSFWHDKPDAPEMQVKYRRRIDRFKALPGDDQLALFVRAAATTDEILEADKLLKVLTAKFGEGAVALLLVVDWQTTHTGAFVVEELEDMLVYFVESSAHQGRDAHAPYLEAVQCALGWLRGEELNASCVESLQSLHQLVDETHWGYVGLGGLQAFEDLEPREKAAGASATGAEPAAADAIGDMSSTAMPGMVVVSLGHSSQTQACVQQLGLHSASGMFPFDFCRVRVEGLFHFIEHGFDDFFTMTSSIEVEGMKSIIRRSPYHAFWQEQELNEGFQQMYKVSFQRFEQLKHAELLKVFVRVVATTEELARMGELHRLLMDHFGANTVLLVVADFQEKSRFLVIKDQTSNFLAGFLAATAHANSGGFPYSDVITKGVNWVMGKEQLQAGVAPDFDSLQSIAAPSHWGLQLPGGASGNFFDDLGTAMSAPETKRRSMEEDEKKQLAQTATSSSPAPIVQSNGDAPSSGTATQKNHVSSSTPQATNDKPASKGVTASAKPASGKAKNATPCCGGVFKLCGM